MTDGGAVAGSPELRLSAKNARFNENKIPGDRGSDGRLTGPKRKEWEAVEAARRSVVGDYRGDARVRRSCGLRGRRACGKDG